MGQICVGALILQRHEELRVLLGRRSASRSFYPNVWDLPGGHCEPGESPEQTLVREIQEEIGVTPTTWRLLSELVVPVLGRVEPMIQHVYEVTAWSGALYNRLPEEHAEVAWFTIVDACQLALAHDAYPALFRRLTPTP